MVPARSWNTYYVYRDYRPPIGRMTATMKNYVIIVLTLVSIFLSGCFLAGLGVGAAAGGTAVHVYDTKPAPTPVVE